MTKLHHKKQKNPREESLHGDFEVVSILYLIASLSEATLASGIVSQSFVQFFGGEVGPEYISEIQLRVCSLIEQVVLKVSALRWYG